MRVICRAALCIGALVMSNAGLAQPAPADEIAALRAEIAALSARLDSLEQGRAPASVPAAVVEAPVQQASSRIELDGDLRYRQETINDDFFAERNRHRIRARIGLDARVTDDVTVGVVLASGGDNPVSGNQTLDGGFTRKDIGFDRAFFSWEASDEIEIRGGKMGNPFVRPGGHHLIWDSDANPEGLALRWERGRWFANAGGFFADERGSGEDAVLLGGQFGLTGTIADGVEYRTGLTYYDYRNTQGGVPFYEDDPQGNSVDGAGNYLYDFNTVEIFGEAEFDLGGRPFSVFADYARNTEAGDADTGYALGLAYGDVTGRGTWEVGYAYQVLEADAVIATFTDSDFGGGGTDSRGHVFEMAYGLADRWSFAFKYFLNERGEQAGEERDYNRLQADLNFRY